MKLAQPDRRDPPADRVRQHAGAAVSGTVRGGTGSGDVEIEETRIGRRRHAHGIGKHHRARRAGRLPRRDGQRGHDRGRHAERRVGDSYRLRQRARASCHRMRRLTPIFPPVPEPIDVGAPIEMTVQGRVRRFAQTDSRQSARRRTTAARAHRFGRHSYSVEKEFRTTVQSYR